MQENKCLGYKLPQFPNFATSPNSVVSFLVLMLGFRESGSSLDKTCLEWSHLRSYFTLPWGGWALTSILLNVNISSYAGLKIKRGKSGMQIRNGQECLEDSKHPIHINKIRRYRCRSKRETKLSVCPLKLSINM